MSDIHLQINIKAITTNTCKSLEKLRFLAARLINFKSLWHVNSIERTGMNTETITEIAVFS